MYALVTGATSGIGLEMARLLAQMNYNLIIVGRREERLNKIKEDFSNEYNINVETYKADLSSITECEELLAFTNQFNDISVVINSAGFGKVGHIVETDLYDDIDMIKTNVISLHLITKHFSKIMDKGNIVNISSIAGVAPVPYMAAYGASKAYVMNYSLALNYEMKKLHKDVQILAACPGPVDTEFDNVAGSKFKWKGMSAKRCANIIIKAMFKKRRRIFTGFKTNMAFIGLKFAPISLSLLVEYRLQIKKTKK